MVTLRALMRAHAHARDIRLIMKMSSIQFPTTEKLKRQNRSIIKEVIAILVSTVMGYKYSWFDAHRTY